MNPTPLLEFWNKESEAGNPIALLATTFRFDPIFFEQNCLARFLEVSSIDEGSGSVDDIIARSELQEALQKVNVTVLTDRSAPGKRSSLLWDLLSCRVEGTGLLHAKVAVLLWENRTRVILGSANLTRAGYRRNIELALAADFGPGCECLFPPDVLVAIADELENYLNLVPGRQAGGNAYDRALKTLDLFRSRIDEHQQRIPRDPPWPSVAFAPTNANASPLDQLDSVWGGKSKPLRATHLSPFWDSKDPEVLNTVRDHLKGRKGERLQRVAVVPDVMGAIAFSSDLRKAVDTVHQLKIQDEEFRTLHAKCLLVESDEWVAALVGSSNHTKAGLGLQMSPRHQEMNVWIGAPSGSKEGKSLRALIELGEKISITAQETDPLDEDEMGKDELPPLPTCFGLCQVMKNQDGVSWSLHLGICSTSDMPDDWRVSLHSGAPPVQTRRQWETGGKPESVVIPLKNELPQYIFVEWSGNQLIWTVIAEDRHDLPPHPKLSELSAQHVLDALAADQSPAQALRRILNAGQSDGKKPRKKSKRSKDQINLDPLRRLEVKGSLLRKGRALSASLSVMQRRLAKPAATLDVLRARLKSPLGPEFLATKIAEAVESGHQTKAEGLFTVAEIALAVGRVDWASVLAPIKPEEEIDQGRERVRETLNAIDAQLRRIGNEESGLGSYARRAIEEARKCLPC